MKGKKLAAHATWKPGTELMDPKRAVDMDLFLASIVESTDNAIIGKTLDGIIVSWNVGAEKIYGYPAKEVIGKPISILIPPNELDEFQQISEKIRQGEKVDHYETVRIRKDGRTIYVSLTVSPIKNKSGKIIGASTIAVDVTDRKLAEERYQAAKDFLDKIIDSIADPIFVKDKEHRFVLVNDALCRMIGRDRQNLLGKSDYDFFPKEQADIFWEKDEIVLKTGKENVNEEKITDIQGKTLTIITKKTSYTNKQGEKFIVGVIRDVTDHKLREEEQRRYAENQSMLIQASPTPIIVIDADGKIALVNRSAKNLLGYESEEILGRSFSKVLSKGRNLEIADRMNFPMRFENKMGEEIPVAVSTSVQIFKDKRSGMQARGLIVTFSDLSELQGLYIAPVSETPTETTEKGPRPELESGYVYLAEEERPIKSIAAFRYLVEHGNQGLLISRLRAEKVKTAYHLERTPHIWLTRNKIPEENCIGPDELTKLYKTVENFLDKAERGALFFDGMEYLIAQNGFGIVLKFLNSLNDVIMLRNSLAIWVLDPLALNTPELHTLRRETMSFQNTSEEKDLRRRNRPSGA